MSPNQARQERGVEWNVETCARGLVREENKRLVTQVTYLIPRAQRPVDWSVARLPSLGLISF